MGNSSSSINIRSLAALRRRLVAVPFHLFVGEDGNDAYQRRIRKMASRAERHTARGMLMAALSGVPADSVDKSVGDYFRMEGSLGGLEKDGAGGGRKHHVFVERSGPLQKSIY
jgi:hypothetical protein